MGLHHNAPLCIVSTLQKAPIISLKIHQQVIHSSIQTANFRVHPNSKFYFKKTVQTVQKLAFRNAPTNARKRMVAAVSISCMGVACMATGTSWAGALPTSAAAPFCRVGTGMPSTGEPVGHSRLLPL